MDGVDAETAAIDEAPDDVAAVGVGSLDCLATVRIAASRSTNNQPRPCPKLLHYQSGVNVDRFVQNFRNVKKEGQLQMSIFAVI